MGNSREVSETDAVEVEEFHPLNATSPNELETPEAEENPEYGKVINNVKANKNFEEKRFGDKS